MTERSRAEALKQLSAPDALKNLREMIASETDSPKRTRDVNNHIHTTYSFSPYSPAAAVWFARQAGLCTCGLMDHDSIAGAEEFLRAADIAGMAATIGLECRVSFHDTPFCGRRINNPDQDSIVYMALHGIPRGKTAEVNAFFAKYRALRNVRNRRMVDAINELTKPVGISIDFDRDVLPLSQFAKGGSVTERHLSRALSEALIRETGGGERLVRFLKERLQMPLSERVEKYLTDVDNPYAMYDLLGAIKSGLISRFYIDATDECPDVRDVLALSERVGAISAYAYLGDVGDSVTGDKRAQRFEDAYLDSLIPYLKEIGFRAVTYMPSRNSAEQLAKLRNLLEQNELFQISGEDINSPRQSFVCEKQREPAFANLYTATWALIAHEKRADIDPQDGLFSGRSVERTPALGTRAQEYAEWALARYAHA